MSAMSLVGDLQSSALKSHSVHNSLVRIIESISLETANAPEYSGKVVLDLDTVEELASIASKLCDLDQHIMTSCRKLEVEVRNAATLSFDELRQDLQSIRREVKASKQYLSKKATCISIVINEFRTRCREELIHHLKEMDLELRKIIKPLVPNKILAENIKYKPINSNPSLLNSMASTQKSLPDTIKNSESKDSDEEQQVGGHLQMLVTTLETVAKELINIIFAVDHKYYELVDPKELNSGPPTPLAAPLPEYFSFKFDNEKEESQEVGAQSFVLSEDSKKKILGKLNEFQKDPARLAKKLNKNTFVLVKRMLRKVPAGQLPTESDLATLLNDKFLSVVDKEELVFDLINSDVFDDSAISKSSEAILTVENESRFQRKLELQEKSKQLRKQSNPQDEKTLSEGRHSLYDKRYSLPENRVGGKRIKSEISIESSPKPEIDRGKASRILAYNTDSRKSGFEDDSKISVSPITVKRRMSPLGDGVHISRVFRKQNRNVSPEMDTASRNTNLSKAYSASKISSRNSREVRVRSVTPVFGQETKSKKQRTPQSRIQRKKAMIALGV
mmetsp:Transcript_7314/g.13523  ORF Transcript_7314/g.13523 Transcript_7314/m.13523 type:complete len:561 (-) Transcript_7314:210-1892(-)